MRSIAIFIVLLTFGSLASADGANARPRGANCELAAPPSDAGEEMNHGITLKIYPRAKDIDARYTGCQLMFAPNGDKWAVVAMTEIVKGDPIRIWGTEHDPMMDCRFNHGHVVRGDPMKCPVPEFLLMKSMGPGCVETIRKAVAKEGLGAHRPKVCEYQ